MSDTRVWRARISAADEREYTIAAAEERYGEMVADLAAGEEIDFAELERLCEILGRSVDQFADDLRASL